MVAIPPANSTKTFVLRMFRLQSFFAFNNTWLNFYVDMQQCVFLFLGLTESNNSSVNEITFRNKLNLRLCLPRTDYDTRAVLRDEMCTLPRRLNFLKVQLPYNSRH